MPGVVGKGTADQSSPVGAAELSDGRQRSAEDAAGDAADASDASSAAETTVAAIRPKIPCARN